MTADAIGSVWRYALDLAGGFSQAGIAVTLAKLGPSASPEQRRAADAAVARLAATEWDDGRLGALASGAAALRLAPPDGVEQELIAQDACPVIAPRGPNLAGCVPARQRRKLRRADTPPDEFLDLLFARHRARWRSRGEGGVLADPRVQAFHRIALSRLQARGIARMFHLCKP
jgi:hypothetical protein